MARSTPNKTISELFPIRTVSTLTGINPITLRAWERRYGLIRPVRTDSGHRLYTQDDIDTIHRVIALLDKGMAIGQVRKALHAATAEIPGRVSDQWTQYREKMINAIARFDEWKLEDLYNEALGLYPSDLVTRLLLLPLLEELGVRWATAAGSVAEEHFFGVFLRNKLGARFHHRARQAAGPKLLACTLPGERHEVGLLLFALAAHEAGFRVVLLGADVPLADLPHALRASQSDAIVLSGSIEPQPDLLQKSLPELVEAVKAPVIVGGLTSVRFSDAITAAGAQAMGNDIPTGIRRIAELLNHPIPNR
jgi:DNA-binding transcriptional MerR regulator/methylmalonyl-CoA mutase cobalamin-binding subunit